MSDGNRTCNIHAFHNASDIIGRQMTFRQNVVDAAKDDGRIREKRLPIGFGEKKSFVIDCNHGVILKPLEFLLPELFQIGKMSRRIETFGVHVFDLHNDIVWDCI